MFLINLIICLWFCSPPVHISSSDTIPADELMKMIETGQPVQLKNCTITGDVNFIRSFPSYCSSPTVEQIDVPAPLYFEKCRFTGSVSTFATDSIATLTRFTAPVGFFDCSFQEEVDFTGSQFSNGLLLNKSLFHKPVKLQACRVDGDLRLEQASFNSDLSAQEIIISGACWAKDVTIAGKLLMQQADFWQNAFFAASNIYGYADFGLANFRKSAFFEYSKFHGPANFSSAIFSQRAEWTKCTFNNTADMSNAWFAMKPALEGITAKKRSRSH